MLGTEWAVAIRETASSHDVASLIACFCIAQNCTDWFVSLPLTSKIEVIFLFRGVIYGRCDIETAKRMFMLVEHAECAVPALDLLERITKLQIEAMCDSLKAGNLRWSFEEDVVLFSAMFADNLTMFKYATGRTSRAIRRRIEHWINIAEHMLSLDFDDIWVDERIKEDEKTYVEVVEESVKESVEESVEESVDRELSPDTETNAPKWTDFTRGQRMAMMAKTGKTIQALKKQCTKAQMAACRAAKKRKGASMNLDGVIQVVGKGSTLLQQLCELDQKEPKVTRRYPKDVKSFWMQIYSVSPCCFEHVSWMLNGPCDATVKSWMRAKKEIIRDELFKLESISGIVSRWRRKWGDGTAVFTLSYDACKLDEDLVINQDGDVSGVLTKVELDAAAIEYKRNPLLYQKLWEQQIAKKNLITHAFVFMLNPVSDARGFPVHVVFSNSGSANDHVLRCIRDIPILLASPGIHIKFEASDSDNKYRMAFTNQFRAMYNQFSKLYSPVHGNYAPYLLDRVVVPSPRRCNDIPHILKRWRARLINNERLFLTTESETKADVWVSVDVIRALAPSIPNTAFRCGSMAAMDDRYPRMIFNIDTLVCAWSQHRFDVVVFLLPAVCAEIVFRKDGISRQRRIEFAFLGWCTCIYYFAYLEDCGRCGKRFRYPMMSRDLVVDMGNALFCQMCAMREIPNEYRAAKVSSVISEHFFARMRRSMGADQSYHNFVRTLLKIVICDLKDSRPTENLKMQRRLFESALCEHGVCNLGNDAAFEVRDFLSALFRVNDVMFSPNADHLSTFASADDSYTLDTSRIVQAFLELQHRVVYPCKFTIHAGQSRVRRIYGRSILSRYQTAAKRDSTAAITVEERIANSEENPPQLSLQTLVHPCSPGP